MDLYEVQETIKKHITIIKKTIIKPLGLDIIMRIPKKGKSQNEKKEHEGDEDFRTEDIKNGAA